MKKALFLSLIMLMLAMTALIACSGGGGDDPTSSPGTATGSTKIPTMEEVDAGDVHDPELKELLTDIEPEQLPTTSFKLIEMAVEAKSIGEDEAMALTLMAGYTPALLPVEYQSETNSGRGDLQTAKLWLVNNWDSLDPAAQAELMPYYVSPDHPDSYINQMNAITSAIPKPAGFVQCADTSGWPHIKATFSEVQGKEAKIHYRSNNTTLAKQAEWIKEAFFETYPLFVSLLGVAPTPTIYVYIQPMSVNGTGYWDIRDGVSRGVIELKEGMDEKLTKATLAHELFHIFQFDMGLKYQPVDQQWLMEATATWAEDYAYPDYNTEQLLLPDFFPNLHRTMIHKGDNREYATYPWFLFLSQATDNDRHVTWALTDAVTEPTKDVIVEMENFDNLFAQFALWNWNRGSFKKYRDNPSFPGMPIDDCYDSKRYDAQKTYEETVSMEQLGMYYHARVFDNDLDMVTYKFPSKGTDKHQRQALVRANGEWRVEDWTHLKERQYCRNRKYEHVEAVVLIISNSDPDKPYQENFIIDTTGECQPQWHGTTKITWLHETSETSSDFTISDNPTTHTTITHGEYVTYEVLEENQMGFVALQTQFVTYNRYDLIRNDYHRECSYLWDYDESKLQGSVFVDYRDESFPRVRWFIIRDENNEPIGVSIDPSVSGGYDWLQGQTIIKSFKKNCDFLGVGFTAPDVTNYQQIFGSGRNVSFDEFEVDQTLSDGEIEGEMTIEVSTRDYGTYDMTLQYSFVNE